MCLDCCRFPMLLTVGYTSHGRRCVTFGTILPRKPIEKIAGHEALAMAAAKMAVAMSATRKGLEVMNYPFRRTGSATRCMSTDRGLFGLLAQA